MPSTTSNIVHLLLAGFVLFSSGCSTVPSEYVPPQSQQSAPRSTVPEPEQIYNMDAPASARPRDISAKPAPRQIASLRLTEQARLLLESKKPDEAIRTLEKALNIDPRNGRNYYFLAEAWLKKGNRRQSLEFNRMAELYLARDTIWTDKVRRQKERIENTF